MCSIISAISYTSVIHRESFPVRTGTGSGAASNRHISSGQLNAFWLAATEDPCADSSRHICIVASTYSFCH